MTINPYSSADSEADSTADQLTPRKISASVVLLAILKYVGSYLLGMVACVLFTPAEMELAGVALWLYYPVFAVVGFILFYHQLAIGGAGPYYWFPVVAVLLPIVLEGFAYFAGKPRLRSFRPLWIAFPIGFVGTLGVYFAASASI
ncbi:MAG: hypothetical protein AAFU85_19655 [Planctomycetota bacterium]